MSFTTRAHARLGIFDYIEAWYNTQRIHSKLNYLSPNEFESLNNNLFEPKIIKINKNMGIKKNSMQV